MLCVYNNLQRHTRKFDTSNIKKAKLISSDEEISETEFHADNIIRLKVTVRKGARIESLPKKKLEKLATKQRLIWKLEND